MAFKSYNDAVKAAAGWIADRIIENANDNGDDVREYSTDEEVVELYLKELAEDISKLLPAEIESQLKD